MSLKKATVNSSTRVDDGWDPGQTFEIYVICDVMRLTSEFSSSDSLVPLGPLCL